MKGLLLIKVYLLNRCKNIYIFQITSLKHCLISFTLTITGVYYIMINKQMNDFQTFKKIKTKCNTHQNFTKTIRNYSGVIYIPKTINECALVVKHAPAPFRVIGNARNWNSHILNETLISTEKLNQCIDIDIKLKQVTVEAGITINQLTPLLETHGFAFPIYTTANITIGGAISVGAYNSAKFDTGTYSDLVVSMDIIDGQGNLVTIPRSDLSAAKMACGLLGIIARVTLTVVENDFYKQQTTVVDMRHEKKLIRAEYERHDHVNYMFIEHTHYAIKVTENKTKKTASFWDTFFRQLVWDYVTFLFSMHLLLGRSIGNSLLWLCRAHPWLKSITLVLPKSRIHQRLDQNGLFMKLVGLSALLRPYSKLTMELKNKTPTPLPPSIATEFMMPLTCLDDFLTDFDKLKQQAQLYGDYFCGLQRLRFQNFSTDCILAPSFGRQPMFSISCAQLQCPGTERLMKQYEQLAITYGGIPHLSKRYTINPFWLNQQRMKKFIPFIKKYDPQQNFQNIVLKSMLAPFF